MLRIKLILFCVLISCKAVFCQNNLTYSKIDSIVAATNNSKKFLNVLDTGRIEQGEIKGRYRDCYIIDTTTNELKAFVTSVTLDVTRNSTFTAYYFYQSKLIKVEIGDGYGGYKKHNLTYLYYINEPREKTDVYQSKELKKLKYLKLSEQYLQNFKEKVIHN